MPGIVSVKGSEKIYNPVRDHINMDFMHNFVEEERLIEIANYLKGGNIDSVNSRAIIFVKSRKRLRNAS
ncbi:MAG: hypothetical protein IPP71_10015 [Bacteroidetes bacterium]|nr:hypothetical protein [Bacteroidota bacterium]